MLMRLSTLGLDLVYTALLLLDANNTLDSARSVASQAPVPEPNRTKTALAPHAAPQNSETLPKAKNLKFSGSKFE